MKKQPQAIQDIGEFEYIIDKFLFVGELFL